MENGYGSIFLDKMKIVIFVLEKGSVIRLENIEGVEICKGDYNFEGLVLEWGVEIKFRVGEDGYFSIFLDKMKIEILDF